jgi:hypothetical protein
VLSFQSSICSVELCLGGSIHGRRGKKNSVEWIRIPQGISRVYLGLKNKTQILQNDQLDWQVGRGHKHLQENTWKAEVEPEKTIMDEHIYKNTVPINQ